MHRTLLSFELRSITPETKFFLVRLVQLYGVAEPVRMGVKELAKATGTTDRVISRSVTELMDADLLNHRKIAAGRGRPKSEYQCSSRLTRLLEDNWHKTALAHEARIDHVLHGKSKQDDAELNITNRLLLAALLGHADQFGAVRDLGLSDLSKLTGLNRERVKSQLHKLHILGIIRSSVPGATSTKLFGPTKSIYLLNLHDAFLTPGDQAAIVLVLTSETDRYLFGMSEAMWIIHAARNGVFDLTWEECQFLPSDDRFKGLAALFSSYTKNLDLAPLLQAKLEEYASILLSRYWQSPLLDENTPTQGHIDAQLVEYIRTDFKSSSGSEGQPATPSSQVEVKKLLAEFLYQVSLLLARRTKKAFLAFKEIPFEKDNFLILPTPYMEHRKNFHNGSRTVLTVPQGETNKNRCYILKKNESGEYNLEYYTHEKRIPLEDRYKYGLITKVKAPKRYGLRDRTQI